ncbi:M23 family metallopeptidase [Bradyrhizobium sp.]|uniref:M23 family metallopeptidase n=1 Tax=Bradyrhizobium sp. TaxID=376 RepID=UPI001EC50996|nr:M23 family metallopeptidase [Bradyrhizobium sp.]MBV9984904.1 peptidoglycan DD-metalloendopeptidase family protein [Bradyrhizobium sp.]
MKTKAVRYVARTLASFVLLKAGTAVAIDQFRTPAISVIPVEWRAALDQFRAEISAAPAVAADFTFATQRHLRPLGPRSMPAFVQLNAATSAIFPGINRSPVPVLLPFDVAGWLNAGGNRMTFGVARYQADFRSTDFFDAGPSGYDAVFSLEPGAGDGLPQRTFARPIEVQITGSQLIYDIADPPGGMGEPVKALSAQYPDLRRFIREGYVRYAFTRFGVPYVVSIQCLDSVPRPRRLACREAYPVAERFLRALRIAGGQPSQPRGNILAGFAERPPNYASDFTYRPVGDILARSGPRGQIGNADLTSYSQIRFPLDAPAFIHSQSFGRRQSGDSSDRPSGLYPWRDNFCEARSFNVGQCAGGHGHQGQDLRAGACPAPSDSSNSCDPKQQPVFAVRDGILIRARQQQAATLQVNTLTEHIRFRYMHMNPASMDADGVLNGRVVAEGEKIGVVSNYLDHPNGTSRHLHFDVQVFTRDGWIWVNPYITLVSAYERLIRGRGREIGPLIAASPIAARTQQDDAIRLDPQEGREN